ncbi:transcription factor ILR3 [Selaginella moellendorffii]|uniref:transcription factor ILR3 n=1 Tax=Selaginella moellendorffii TaxID=88036 RepID=UPI000D1C8ACE|nr:transcription factor ILR3 [Selaginella moellendorffii]|eukprot:XP_024522584.1 transcription factor ILR3 [Selaginella moellendorffii]
MAYSCFSAQSRQWLAFLDESLLEELTKPQPILVLSSEQQEQVQLQHGSCFRAESLKLDKSPRKRPRDDATSSKAVREKMRRDKLNDKFFELSGALEPGRPLKSDKSAILIEAACVLLQLRQEAQQLKESNDKLREAVKDLKIEKNELRDEKLRLKAEKERLEEQLKTFSVSFVPHPAYQAAAAAAALAAQNHSLPPSEKLKLETVSAFPAGGMWQWMPSSSTSTEDSLLRPPVA